MAGIIKIIAALILLIPFTAAWAQPLEGTGAVLGDSCVGKPTGSTTLTADYDLDLTNVVLICDGAVWRGAYPAAPAGSFFSIQYNANGNLGGTWGFFAGSASTNNMSIGASVSSLKLTIGGEARFGSTGAACSATNEGAIRYNSASGNILEHCDGADWTPFAIMDPRPTWDRKAGIFSSPSVSAVCGMRHDGKVYCWGSNNTYGMQGVGDTTTSTIPRPVNSSFFFRDGLESHTFHTFAIRDNGLGYAWGYGGNGALGTGSTAQRTSPHPMAGSHLWRDLSPGGNHSCGVKDDGDGYCWGNSNSGVICGVTSGHKTSPERVAGGHTFKQISGGWLHNCGITDTGAAYCWGASGSGRRGDGGAGGSCPFAVAGGHTFTQISVGYEYACALKDNGDAYCWGANASGQLGDNSTTNRSSPVLVHGGHKFREIAAGESFTCAISMEGQRYCWGAAVVSRGISGGTFLTPTPVTHNYNYSTTSAGYFASCGVRSDTGLAYCTGFSNTTGYGGATSSIIPYPVKIPQ